MILNGLLIQMHLVGSVWDASEKVNKDKRSELLGVSYTKYPSLEKCKCSTT